MYALIFLMIFGGAILLTAGALAISKDPREHAKKVAKVLAIVGASMIVVCGIGVLICMMMPE